MLFTEKIEREGRYVFSWLQKVSSKGCYLCALHSSIYGYVFPIILSLLGLNTCGKMAISQATLNKIINLFPLQLKDTHSSAFSGFDQPAFWSRLEEFGALSSYLCKRSKTVNLANKTLEYDNLIAPLLWQFTNMLLSATFGEPLHLIYDEHLNSLTHLPSVAPRPAQFSVCSRGQTPSFWVAGAPGEFLGSDDDKERILGFLGNKRTILLAQFNSYIKQISSYSLYQSL